MPIKRQVDHLPEDIFIAKGLFKNDWEAMTPYQRKCTDRFAKTIQLEEESYMTEHPEVPAMLKMLVASITKLNKKKRILPHIAMFFVRPYKEIINDINAAIGTEGPPFIEPGKTTYSYQEESLKKDLMDIFDKHFPRSLYDAKKDEVETPETVSSTFVSIETSETTLPTPKSEPTPEPTIEYIMYTTVSNAVDKAIYSKVTDYALAYDTAYVELKKAVEEAMNIPVVVIKEDIALMFSDAYKKFELIIIHKARIAAEKAWEKRTRKKVKHALRLQNNFTGYEPKPTNTSSNVSPREPITKSCECFPQYKFNRYHKDSFGVYTPITHDDGKSATMTPIVSCVLKEQFDDMIMINFSPDSDD